MDSLDIAEDWQQVLDQVAILNARGQAITVEEVAALTLKRGLQEMLDDRAGDAYYTAAWSTAGQLLVYDMYQDQVAVINPAGESLVKDFEDNAARVWERFSQQLRTFITR